MLSYQMKSAIQETKDCCGIDTGNGQRENNIPFGFWKFDRPAPSKGWGFILLFRHLTEIRRNHRLLTACKSRFPHVPHDNEY